VGNWVKIASHSKKKQEGGKRMDRVTRERKKNQGSGKEKGISFFKRL